MRNARVQSNPLHSMLHATRRLQHPDLYTRPDLRSEVALARTLFIKSGRIPLRTRLGYRNPTQPSHPLPKSHTYSQPRSWN